MDEYIKQRMILIETYKYMIDRYTNLMRAARNGEVALLQEKIKVLTTWLTRTEDQINAYSFGALSATCEHFNISENDLKSRSRKGILVKARKLYVILSINEERKSLYEVAHRINRSHCTAIYYRDSYQFESDIYPDLRKDYRDIKKRMDDLKKIHS